MFPPFFTESAHHYCIKLISDLDNGSLILKQISKISEERKNQGVMLGSLVCYDSVKKRRVILHAVSGIAKQICLKNSKKNYFYQNGEYHKIVSPIVSSRKITLALKKNDKKIHELTALINQNHSEKLSAIRKELCDQSLKKVFSLYNFTRYDGKKTSLNHIIRDLGHLPPTGTGDCCAPKLLDYAFKHNLEILSMDEVFYGNDTKNKINGCSYEPCNERCGIILPYLLGIEVLYQDSQIVVVNKPSGLLSVPGRGRKKRDCVESRVKRLYPECINQPAAHRLDMETSGILVLAKTEDAFRNLSIQFMNGLVQKKYIAVLDGILEKADGLAVPKKGEEEGRIELRFRLDVNNRPYQIYDDENGKLGITLWKKDGTFSYVNKCGQTRKGTKIIFTPLTGRTHQLRLAASDKHGFGLPIIGDSLYGKCSKGERLMLHAEQIDFYHPLSGRKLHFEKEFTNYFAFF